MVLKTGSRSFDRLSHQRKSFHTSATFTGLRRRGSPRGHQDRSGSARASFHDIKRSTRWRAASTLAELREGKKQTSSSKAPRFRLGLHLSSLPLHYTSAVDHTIIRQSMVRLSRNHRNTIDLIRDFSMKTRGIDLITESLKNLFGRHEYVDAQALREESARSREQYLLWRYNTKNKVSTSENTTGNDALGGLDDNGDTHRSSEPLPADTISDPASTVPVDPAEAEPLARQASRAFSRPPALRSSGFKKTARVTFVGVETTSDGTSGEENRTERPSSADSLTEEQSDGEATSARSWARQVSDQYRRCHICSHSTLSRSWYVKNGRMRGIKASCKPVSDTVAFREMELTKKVLREKWHAPNAQIRSLDSQKSAT